MSKARKKFFMRLHEAVDLKGGHMVSWEDFKRFLHAFQIEEENENKTKQNKTEV